VRGRPADAVASTLPLNRPNFPNTPVNAYSSTLPSPNARRPSEDGPSFGRFGSGGLADEFGVPRQVPAATVTSPIVTTTTASKALSTTSSNSTTARRPDSSGGGNRYKIANPQPHDIPPSTPARQRSATGSGPTSGGAQRSWPTAEEEKLRLYEKARAQVERVQGPAATPVCSLCDLS